MPHTPLSPSEYYDTLSRYVLPMFPGAELSRSPVSAAGQDVLLPESSTKLLVTPDADWPYSFRLTRQSYPFEERDVALIGHFIRAFREKLVSANEPFFTFLVDKCAEEAVANAVKRRNVDDTLLPNIIYLLKKWASQTYEGQRVSAAIGVDAFPDPARISNVHLDEIQNKDFAKVLSNGMDTLIVLSPSGHVVDHVALSTPSASPPSRKTSDWPFAPMRYLPLANWADRGRVAFTLNRLGEILVFTNRCLQFAFRRGTWFHFAHSAMIARMRGSRKQRNLMRAVYSSCLDISFSRTGGCIALAKKRNAPNYSEYLNPADILRPAHTKKAVLLSHLIGQPFQGIPRAKREELAALDGAIVLDHEGKVITAGAIVSVPGGSDGGGRRAAAKALSRLGLAVKVSADGGITAFTDREQEKIRKSRLKHVSEGRPACLRQGLCENRKRVNDFVNFSVRQDLVE